MVIAPDRSTALIDTSVSSSGEVVSTRSILAVAPSPTTVTMSRLSETLASSGDNSIALSTSTIARSRPSARTISAASLSPPRTSTWSESSHLADPAFATIAAAARASRSIGVVRLRGSASMDSSVAAFVSDAPVRPSCADSRTISARSQLSTFATIRRSFGGDERDTSWAGHACDTSSAISALRVGSGPTASRRAASVIRQAARTRLSATVPSTVRTPLAASSGCRLASSATRKTRRRRRRANQPGPTGVAASRTARSISRRPDPNTTSCPLHLAARAVRKRSPSTTNAVRAPA
jgi:hypothetical protein